MENFSILLTVLGLFYIDLSEVLKYQGVKKIKKMWNIFLTIFGMWKSRKKSA